jgi:predicted nucleic acid-binding protein
LAILVVDACALVHLKQAHHPRSDGLDLVSSLCAVGLRLVSTNRVHQENEQQTLRGWLAERATAGAYSLESVSVTERRSVQNHLPKKAKEPGHNDKALIALAKRLDAPLLTHDGPAAVLADACNVIVVDAIDLAAFASRNGVISMVEAERMVAPLGEHAWRPPSWAGSVEETVGARPNWDRLEQRLLTWWAAQRTLPFE